MQCSVIEHCMTSLIFQTAVQKNEAKLSLFVKFENERATPRTIDALNGDNDAT